MLKNHVRNLSLPMLGLLGACWAQPEAHELADDGADASGDRSDLCALAAEHIEICTGAGVAPQGPCDTVLAETGRQRGEDGDGHGAKLGSARFGVCEGSTLRVPCYLTVSSARALPLRPRLPPPR